MNVNILKVREREMAIFLDLVINTEMNPTLLSLLQVICFGNKSDFFTDK